MNIGFDKVLRMGIPHVAKHCFLNGSPGLLESAFSHFGALWGPKNGPGGFPAVCKSPGRGCGEDSSLHEG